MWAVFTVPNNIGGVIWRWFGLDHMTSLRQLAISVALVATVATACLAVGYYTSIGTIRGLDKAHAAAYLLYAAYPLVAAASKGRLTGHLVAGIQVLSVPLVIANIYTWSVVHGSGSTLWSVIVMPLIACAAVAGLTDMIGTVAGRLYGGLNEVFRVSE